MDLVSRRDGWQAVVMYLDSIAFTTEHLCDGFVPKNWPRLNGYTAASARLLVDVGLWHEVSDLYPEDGQGIKDGYVINDYDAYQISRAQWTERGRRAQAAAKKAAAERWGRRLRAVSE